MAESGFWQKDGTYASIRDHKADIIKGPSQETIDSVEEEKNNA
jgi:hypothetical protein